jgi:1-acyl-sn-glycerol-3-phosphate acyltransferase
MGVTKAAPDSASRHVIGPEGAMTPACVPGGLSSEKETSYYGACRRIVYLASVVFFHVRHYGRGNVPNHGPVILASNHQCFWDPVLVGTGAGRMLYFLTRASAFRHLLLGNLLVSVNAVPVERGQADHRALRRAVELVSRGNGLLLFPEGTRTHDGSIGPFKPGIVSIAQHAGCPIVPVAIRGGFEAWPRQRRWPLPGRVSVAYGPALDPGKGRTEARVVTARLEQSVRALYEGLAWRHSWA